MLLRDLPDVLLELPIRRVHVAIPEDHFAVVVPSRDRLDKHVRQPAGRVEAHQFVQGVELKPAGGQRHQLALASRAVVVCGQEEARHSRGRLVDDGQLAEAAGVPEPRDRGELRVHLQPRGAAGEEQVGQAGLRGDGPVDQEGVVDQDALGAPFDREPGRGRVAAHQRRFDAEVADDLQVGGYAAVGAEGARGRRAAHGELRDVRRGGVEGAGRRHRHVSVQADASVREAGQQGPVLLADGDQGVLDLEVARRALQLGRLHEGGGGEAVDRQVGRGGDAAAVLQRGDAAVDGRDRAAERVEGGHQRVAAVALGLAPAVRLDLDDAPVAQDGAPGEGRPEEQAADDLGRELVLDEVEKAVAFGHRRIPSKVPVLGVLRDDAVGGVPDAEAQGAPVAQGAHGHLGLVALGQQRGADAAQVLGAEVARLDAARPGAPLGEGRHRGFLPVAAVEALVARGVVAVGDRPGRPVEVRVRLVAREGHGPVLLDRRLVGVQELAAAADEEHGGAAPGAELPDLQGGDAPLFPALMASKSERTSGRGSCRSSASCLATQSLSFRASKALGRISEPL